MKYHVVPMELLLQKFFFERHVVKLLAVRLNPFHTIPYFDKPALKYAVNTFKNDIA